MKLTPRWIPLFLLFAGAWAFTAMAEDLAVEQSAPTGPAAASVVPDPSLEAALRAEILSKRDNTDPLTVEDLATISRLVASRLGITSLAGLQHCRGLRLIDLSDNAISDLTPIADLTRLQSVTLAGNQIRDISPLSRLIAIQLLDLSRNQVDTLNAIGKMRNLRTLYVADNRVSSIAPLASLTNITALDLAGNSVSDLSPIAESRGLTTLEISDNQVRSLQPLTGLSGLSMLIMPNNPIESFDPLLRMCVEDARSDRLFAPYLKIYFNFDGEPAKRGHDAIAKLRELGVSLDDYRRPTATKPKP